MCLWCKKPCGDRNFCDADCYEQYEEAAAEYAAKSAAEWLINPEPEFTNEWCGSRGCNN